MKSYDLAWTMSLFGSAVGAGVLFLPLKAGAGGVYPLLVLCALALPMIFYSHWALYRYCKDDDIIVSSQKYYNKNFAFIITLLYFLAFFSACVMYGISISNTVFSFLKNSLEITNISYFKVVFSSISILMLIMFFKEDFIIRICEILVYPLCAILFAFSLFLIAHWDFSNLSKVPNSDDFVLVILSTLPILALTFNYSPTISTFAKCLKQHYKDPSNHAKRIILSNSFLLLFFVMFFVFSCVMCLEPKDFELAKAQNIPIPSYFANKLNNPILSFVAPFVAIFAISTSFVGHYFGAREGFCAVLRHFKKELNLNKSKKIVDLSSYVIFLSISYLNLNVLKIIDIIIAPIIIAILFLLPICSFYKVKCLAYNKQRIPDLFIFLLGILGIIVGILEFLRGILEF